jgi:toxin FitB
MIILDTNVVSEGWKPRPDAQVIAWLDSLSQATLFLCTPVLAELRYGVERLPQSARRTRMEAWIDHLETQLYRDRVLPFDRAAAWEFGRLAALRERFGRRIEPMDALIAAIASAHGAAVATRDVHDFEGTGVVLINPFDH